MSNKIELISPCLFGKTYWITHSVYLHDCVNKQNLLSEITKAHIFNFLFVYLSGIFGYYVYLHTEARSQDHEAVLDLSQNLYTVYKFYYGMQTKFEMLFRIFTLSCCNPNIKSVNIFV